MRLLALTPIHVPDAEVARRQARYDAIAPPSVTVVVRRPEADLPRVLAAMEETPVAAGAPAEALVPLMRRTIDNDFDLTGPIARGDRAVVESHLAALRRELPDLEPLYRTLADATTP